MRGKQSVPKHQRRAVRITPADAGKTLSRLAAAPCSADHPRGCGENYARSIEITYNPGITPADAGKTLIIGQYDQPR